MTTPILTLESHSLEAAERQLCSLALDKAGNIVEAAKLLGVTRHALKRRIIEDLRPSSLSNLGLTAALEILTREYAERAGIDVETSLEPVQLPDAAQLTVYRMVQEALTNIGKYAKASKVLVSVGADLIVSLLTCTVRTLKKSMMAIRHRTGLHGCWTAKGRFGNSSQMRLPTSA
mgnify:CR=1 FL=1